MAQCRAHCLNQFVKNDVVDSDKKCKRNSACFGCWTTCEKLSLNFPIWSFNCGHGGRCESGCQTACEFVSKYHDEVVPLSHYKSRLTLIFRGTSAHWSLAWDTDAPAQHAVFALFTKSSRRSWKPRLQTADFGCSLEGVPPGSEMKLVAVAESGLLSVIITPFDPPDIMKGVGNKADHVPPTNEYIWTRENLIDDNEVTSSWTLFYEASVQKSSLVAAKVWWESQRPFGSDYLVTWEVAGGGLKGHLYTDLPEVDLTLWPETIYKVQVEVVSRPLTDTRASEPLILDTHNITLQARSSQKVPSQPLIKPYSSEKPQIEIVIGAVCGIFAAVLLISFFIYRRRTRHSSSPLNESSSSSSKLTLDRSIADSPFEQTLIQQKGHSLSTPDNSVSAASPTSPIVPNSFMKSAGVLPSNCPAARSSNSAQYLFNSGILAHQHFCQPSHSKNHNCSTRAKAKISVI